MRTLLVCLYVTMAVSGSAASADELTVKEAAAARNIYAAKCAKCHQFYEPKNYSESDWRTWMGKMKKKSKLKEEQATLLNGYLDAYRAGRFPTKPELEVKPAPAAKQPRADSR